MSVETYVAEDLEAALLRQEGLAALNDEFAQLEPVERIEKAAELFAGRLVLSSSFGPTAPVLLKMAVDAVPDIPVVTIRHGYETEETRELTEWYRRTFELDLRVYEAPRLPIPPDGTEEFAQFQRRTKVEPFQSMLDQLQPHAYLSGAMRWQTDWRAELPFVQDKGSVLAVYPLADLGAAAVEDFFARTGLPRTTDYFDPAKGTDQKTECGLNTAQYASGVAA